MPTPQASCPVCPTPCWAHSHQQLGWEAVGFLWTWGQEEGKGQPARLFSSTLKVKHGWRGRISSCHARVSPGAAAAKAAISCSLLSLPSCQLFLYSVVGWDSGWFWNCINFKYCQAWGSGQAIGGGSSALQYLLQNLKHIPEMLQPQDIPVKLLHPFLYLVGLQGHPSPLQTATLDL